MQALPSGTFGGGGGQMPRRNGKLLETIERCFHICKGYDVFETDVLER